MPVSLKRSFHFSAAPIHSCPGIDEVLSARTRDSLLTSDWVSASSFPTCSSEPSVYVAEAFGGADQAELGRLFDILAARGSSVILVWTDDYRFEYAGPANVLTFWVGHDEPLSCGYFWKVDDFGPRRINQWKRSSERSVFASFIGSAVTHPCRRILFERAIAARQDVVVEDVNWWASFQKQDAEEQHHWRGVMRDRFMAIAGESKFLFCPRGNGPSSIRRWEAAYAGAIPVLLNDETCSWDARTPCIRFRVGEHDAFDLRAAELIAHLAEYEAGLDALQETLAEELRSGLDYPSVYAHHTGTKKIIEVANARWKAGGGFLV